MKRYLYVVAVSFGPSEPIGFKHAFVLAWNNEQAYKNGFEAVRVLPDEQRLNDYVIDCTLPPGEFKKGERVRYNARGRENAKRPDQTGTYVNQSRDGENDRIHWDGATKPRSIHRGFIEPAE